MADRGTETEFELTTIERLELLGYRHTHGENLARDRQQVVLQDRLRGFLEAQYPDLPADSVELAIKRFGRPEGVDTLRRNMAFHKSLARGVEIPMEKEDGTTEHRHIYAINWDDPNTNDFLVVNQLSVSGKNDRRPDIVIFINGLPLVLFELKNPYSEQPTVDDALNQIGHYTINIPQLFEFNALTVVSDGITTLHGMWTAGSEWFSPWKSIDGFHIEAGTTGTMKMLIEGLFKKPTLLSYIRDFILFDTANEKITKKGAKYHQFFAVRLAADKAIDAYESGNDKRVGVVWHTTGSGKSLSMVFLVAMLRREPRLKNPTFLIEVDRTDLDNQLHDHFVAARHLVGDVTQARDVDHLRELLKTEGGEVIFTTIEKFRLKSNGDGTSEIEHPELSTRSNVFVVADEAHRSQYGFMKGFARYLSEALPHAKRIGFTGTPVSFSSADTVEVFGDLIHTYDIKQSQEDKTTVPIYYEPRQIRLHLSQGDIDAALDELTEVEDLSDLEARKGRWAALESAAGATERLDALAADLLAHFLERCKTLSGKAMVVCTSRRNCVRFFDALTPLSDCPEVKVVMTGQISKDPKEWNEAGHITTKAQREAIKARMIDPDDPLRIVIVCDMWLTGTDIPCLHTLYIDRPMKDHNIIQAISRVNRVFRDKPHGLIVDYIGIGDELRAATDKYSAGGGRGEPAPEVSEEAVPVFFECLETVRQLLPEGHDYGDWRRLTGIQLEDRHSLVFGHLMEGEDHRDAFLAAEGKLSQAYLLVKHLDECRPYADEIIFYQRVRKQLQKTIRGRKPRRDLEQAVRDLVDDSVETEGVVDIFKLAGITRPDISILDDEFLQTFKDRPLPNVRLKLLEKIVADEIASRRKKNLAKARSFKELLEKTLLKYHNRLIDAAAVVKAMLEIHREMEEDDKRAAELGLTEEELAFYDAVAEKYADLYTTDFLRDVIHDVVQSVKRNLKVDWTKPHREDVKAAVRAAVKRVLRTRGVKIEDLEPFLRAIMDQAAALYADWPLAA